MQKTAIFFIGPQGSDKGTQGKLLAEFLGAFYWEMGAIIRSLRGQETELAKSAVEMIDRGILLPDDVLIEIIRQKISSLPDSPYLIFDGVPRRLGQAEFLLGELSEREVSRFVTFFVNLPKEQSLKRLLNRAVLENRADDTPEAIGLRLRQYEKDTLPVLEYLKEATEFYEIDGNRGIEEVFSDIKSKFE